MNLEVGDCMNVSTLGAEVATVPTIDCAESHEAEVYATTDLPDGDFPGTTSIQASAVEFCSTEFEAFIGESYDVSEIYMDGLMPTEDSWSQGDQEILCYAFEVDGAGDPALRTGTLKSANR